MLNLLKKNCSAVACQCMCVPTTKKNACVVCDPVRVTVTGGALDCFDILPAVVPCSSSE